MKRSSFSLGLIIIALGTIGTNIYHETNQNLTHSLTLFQESLPQGTIFHYDQANANLLVRGVTLHNVTFQNKENFFHAKTIRLGHPKTLPNGQLSLSSLLIKEPRYHDSHIDIEMKRLILRHILIPSDGKLPLSTNLSTESMHSLATLTSFKRSELSHLRFEWGASEGLKFTFLHSPNPTEKTILIQNLTIDKISAEGYGLGGRVKLHLDNLQLKFSLNPSLLAAYLHIPLNLKESSYVNSLPYQLSFRDVDAHLGITQLLNHPFRKNTELAQDFWQNPLHMIWLEPGVFHFNNATLKELNHPNPTRVSLDSFLAERHKEGEKLTTEALLKGFHLHIRNYPIETPLNGRQTTLHLLEHSEENRGEWQSEISSLLTIPHLGTLQASSHASLPDDITDHLASDITLHSTEITQQGSNFVAFLLSFFRAENAPTNTLASPNNNTLLASINTLSTMRPILGPLTDYLIAPHERQIHIDLGHISLETLQKIPFSGSPSAILDSLHITNIHTENPNKTP